MRIPAETYLRIMRNAMAQRLADGKSPQDALFLNGLEEMIARGRGGPVPIEEMQADLQGLLDRVRAVSVGLLDGLSNEVAELQRHEDANADPATYFRRALALLSAIVDRLGEPGLIPSDRLKLVEAFATWEEQVIRAKRVIEPVDASETTASLTEEMLAKFLAAEIPGEANLAIENFGEVMGGMSKRTFRATVTSAARGREELIIKKYDGDPVAIIDSMPIRREFRALQAADAAGLPVPKPLWLGCDLPGANGDFYVMARSEGRCDTSILVDDSPIPERVLLDLAAEMGKMHATPLATLSAFVDEVAPDMPELTADQAVAQRLEEWRQLWLSFDLIPSPMENYLFSWLKANIPPNSAPPSLIHGDLTPHNCLWDDSHLTAILDWECAHFGDPAEDIAYAKPLIEKRMDWTKFIAEYEANGGPKISDLSIAYHSCYLNLRSVILSNVFFTNSVSTDMRPLIVDTDFAGLFVDTCMSGIRNFEALKREDSL